MATPTAGLLRAVAERAAEFRRLQETDLKTVKDVHAHLDAAHAAFRALGVALDALAREEREAPQVGIQHRCPNVAEP